jgi:hypothetical protein
MLGTMCLEVEDDEGRHRRVADVGERDADARTKRLPRDQRPAFGVARRLVGIGDASRHQRAHERADRGEGPHRVEAGGAEEGLADRWAEAEPAPHREPIEPDHPTSPIERSEIDHPRGAGREHHSLPGPQHEASAEEAGEPCRDEVDDAGGRRHQRPHHDHRAAPAQVGEVTGYRAPGERREGERANRDPDGEVARIERPADEARDHGQHRPDRGEREQRDDEQPGEGRVRRAPHYFTAARRRGARRA